jgi:tetratricopeptide (TPR) repeat protein
MLASEIIFNQFYQGLKLLIDFETGQTRGALASPFYAINKVIAHFDAALEEGDVIAPFFLYYIANKFPEYLDKSGLPDLSRVPSHKSKGQLWIDDYQTFLNLHERIVEMKGPRTIEVSSVQKAQMAQKNLQRQSQRLRSDAIHFIKNPSPLARVLAAKIIKGLQDNPNDRELNQLRKEALAWSAFYPNVYGMYEYSMFLNEKRMTADSKEQQDKLETEIKLLTSSNGNLKILVEHYFATRNARFLSQWMFGAAIHGCMELVKLVVEKYIFDDQMEWSDKISNNDKLAEAIKWFDWYMDHATEASVHEYWSQLVLIASNYRETVGTNKYRATFLCHVISRIDQELHEQSKTTPSEEFARRNWDLVQSLQCFRGVVDLTWSLNNNRLPANSAAMVVNEMATILEERHEYKEAERLYRQVYTMDGNNPVHQYNLANILSIQDKNIQEQISLYFQAAKQSCRDSTKYLFRLLVIDGYGSVEDLEALKSIISSPDFDMDFLVPRQLLINFVTATILQRLTNTEIIRWSSKIKDDQKFFNAEFVLGAESVTADTSTSQNSEESSAQASKSASVEPAHPENMRVEPSEFNDRPEEKSALASNFKLFKPATRETGSMDTKRERALNKLHSLNSKPTRSLTLKDFIDAKKSFQILTGESGGIEISHKGKTSGSRAKVGGTDVHLTHGRDRMSIGAQSEIKEAITGFYRGVQS